MTRAARHPEAGLTLIEMMIVLVVIGSAASAVVLGARGLGRDAAVEDEARRLAARLSLAADEALVSRTPLSLRWTARGYAFARWTKDGWQPAATPALTTPQDLPARVTLARADGNETPLAILPDGLGRATAFRLQGRDADWTVRFDGILAFAEPGS